MSPYAQTLWDNFKGREAVGLAEVKERCGFSTHEAFVAASELRKDKLLNGNFEWGGLVSFSTEPTP